MTFAVVRMTFAIVQRSFAVLKNALFAVVISTISILSAILRSSLIFLGETEYEQI
jgi:hypothetical protein